MFASKLATKLLEFEDARHARDAIDFEECISQLSDEQVMGIVGSIMTQCQLSFTTYIAEGKSNARTR